MLKKHVLSIAEGLTNCVLGIRAHRLGARNLNVLTVRLGFLASCGLARGKGRLGALGFGRVK